MKNFLLEKLEELDRKIESTDKDLVVMQKLIGRKMQKLSQLKKERDAASEAYKESLKIEGE